MAVLERVLVRMTCPTKATQTLCGILLHHRLRGPRMIFITLFWYPRLILSKWCALKGLMSIWALSAADRRLASQNKQYIIFGRLEPESAD